MLKEIYTRNSTDPKFNDEILEHSDELENLLGQIRMIMYTKQGDVLGDTNFGFNLEDQLFLFELNANDIKNKLMEMIQNYCPDARKYNLSIEVQFFKGSVRDACLIDILVDNQKMIGVLVK